MSLLIVLAVDLIYVYHFAQSSVFITRSKMSERYLIYRPAVKIGSNQSGLLT